MNKGLVIEWLDRFEHRLRPGAYSLGDVLEVRDQAAMLLEQQFGYDSTAAERMRSVRYQRRGGFGSSLWGKRFVDEMAADVRRAIRNVRFIIDITPEVADAHAAGLPAESRAHLVMLLDEPRRRG